MGLTFDNATDEQIQRGLELLEREEIRKGKIARGEIKGGQKWSELSEEQKAQRRLSTKKRNARLMLLAQKAVEAGITVSEAEIDAAMAVAA